MEEMEEWRVEVEGREVFDGGPEEEKERERSVHDEGERKKKTKTHASLLRPRAASPSTR